MARWKNITKQGDGSWVGYELKINELEITVTSDSEKLWWDATACLVESNGDYVQLFWLKHFTSRQIAQKEAIKQVNVLLTDYVKALRAVKKAVK